MTLIENALAIAQLVVAMFVILGVVKSAYNGSIKDFRNSIEQISDIDERTRKNEETLDDIEDQLDTTSEAVVFLSHAVESEEKRIDTDRVREEMDVPEGPSRFREES